MVGNEEAVESDLEQKKVSTCYGCRDESGARLFISQKKTDREELQNCNPPSHHVCENSEHRKYMLLKLSLLGSPCPIQKTRKKILPYLPYHSKNTTCTINSRQYLRFMCVLYVPNEVLTPSKNGTTIKTIAGLPY